MKQLPVKTNGMYYYNSGPVLNQGKLRKAWNILSSQEVLNSDSYSVIYFGEYYNEKTKSQSYFMGIDLSIVSNNFKELALGYRQNNHKHNCAISDNICYDFDYDGNEMVFQNEIWLGNAKINDNVLYAKFRNKKTGHIFSMNFDYLLQQY